MKDVSYYFLAPCQQELHEEIKMSYHNIINGSQSDYDDIFGCPSPTHPQQIVCVHSSDEMIISEEGFYFINRSIVGNIFENCVYSLKTLHVDRSCWVANSNIQRTFQGVNIFIKCLIVDKPSCAAVMNN